MSKEWFKTEEEAQKEARRMEDQTGYVFDVFWNGDTWEVYQEEGSCL